VTGTGEHSVNLLLNSARTTRLDLLCYKTKSNSSHCEWFFPLEIRIKNQLFLEKTEVDILIPINWFDSFNGSFFASMKLTLHKSQVHRYSVMQWWACSSLMYPPLPPEVGCESRERVVLLLVLIA